MCNERLTPLGIALRELTAAESLLDDLVSTLRNAGNGLGEMEDEQGTEADLVLLLDRTLALERNIVRIRQNLERHHPEPPDADTIADIKYHELKEEGLI